MNRLMRRWLIKTTAGTAIARWCHLICGDMLGNAGFATIGANKPKKLIIAFGAPVAPFGIPANGSHFADQGCHNSGCHGIVFVTIVPFYMGDEFRTIGADLRFSDKE